MVFGDCVQIRSVYGHLSSNKDDRDLLLTMLFSRFFISYRPAVSRNAEPHEQVGERFSLLI